MIDAYVIGVQLMLQDDVSAGLDVINRGLADVDRAIAATSADLAGLVRSAEMATTAVTTAVGGRTAMVTPTGQKPTVALDENVQDNSPRTSPRASAPISAGDASAPTITPVTSDAMAQAKQTSNQPSDGQFQSAPGLDEQVASSSAPLKSAVSDSFLNSRFAETKRNEPEGAAAKLGSVQVIPTSSSASAVAASPAKEIAATGQDPQRSVTSSVTPITFTASVGREMRSPAAAGQSRREQHRPMSDPPVRREGTIAPWSGVNQFGTQSAVMRVQEKPSAPQSAGRGQAEAQGGTVMLDGRLVGQWLSEHMGREASRPPAATSFFDPRQTPAWNVSGAI